jgi:hypothetical protein
VNFFNLARLHPEPPLDRGHPRYRELERARLVAKEREERWPILQAELVAHLRKSHKISEERERQRRLEEEQYLRRLKKPRDDAVEEVDPNEWR